MQLSKEQRPLHEKRPQDLKSWLVVYSNRWQYLCIVAAHYDGFDDCSGAEVHILTARI
jgi:hypothetical protein